MKITPERIVREFPKCAAVIGGTFRTCPVRFCVQINYYTCTAYRNGHDDLAIAMAIRQLCGGECLPP